MEATMGQTLPRRQSLKTERGAAAGLRQRLLTGERTVSEWPLGNGSLEDVGDDDAP